MIRRLLLLVGLVIVATANAQPYQFIHFNKENSGLSFDGINVLKQDSRGYVWVGTQKGLCRYDGVRFKVYDKNNAGFESDHICSLDSDTRGNLWIGTSDGQVFEYDYSTDSFNAMTPKLQTRISAIAHDSRGTIWIGTRENGMWRVDTGSRTLERVAIADSLTNIYRIAIDKYDRMYFVNHYDHIYTMSDGEVSKINLSVSPSYFDKDDIAGIVVSGKSNDILYVASKRKGLCEIDTRAGSVRSLYPLDPDRRPIDLQCDDNRTILLSTTTGLVRYDMQTGAISNILSDEADPFSLSDDYLMCSMQDARGDLWVGTSQMGLNYCSQTFGNFVKIYKTSDGKSLKGCLVRDFEEDKNGNVWVSTAHGGLFRFYPDKQQLVKYQSQSHLPDNINSICLDGGYLWVGSYQGVYRLDTATGEIKHYSNYGTTSDASDNRVITLFRNNSGSLFLGSAMGVFRYDGDADNFVPVEPLKNITVERMAEDSRGVIWLATFSQGVYAYDPYSDRIKGEYCQQSGCNPIPAMTSSMCVDESGGVWSIGLSSGFSVYDIYNDTFMPFDRNVLPSLPTDVFFVGIADGKGHIWLSSDCGLVEFSRNSHLIKVFTTADGLLANTFTKSGIRLSDNRILMGCADGFICFNPDTFNSDDRLAEVAISDVFVNGESLCPGDGRKPNINLRTSVTLSHDQNSFGFHFCLPSSSAQERSNILCRLDGYDDKWTDVTTDKSVSFYNIPPGKYKLQVAQTVAGGQYRLAHKDLQVEIEPTFLLSPLGIATMVLAVLVAVALILASYITRSRKKQQLDQSEFEKAKNEELYHEKMDLFSGIIHEIRTPLTLIHTPLQNLLKSPGVSPSQKEDLITIGDSAEYLDKLVRELLDFIRVEEHGYVLEPKNIDIIDKIDFICNNFTGIATDRMVTLGFEHSEDSIVVAVDENAITKVLNNLIGNAVKYADSYVTVKVEIRDGNVVISFENDGVVIPKERRERIFQPFISFSAERQSYSQGFGIGLSYALKLANLHNGTLVLADRYDCNEFILTLPLRTSSENPDIADSATPDVKLTGQPLILIVEDNIQFSSYLKRKFKSEYIVITSPSAEKALTYLDKYNVDVIVTDISLTGMSGAELCREVSSDVRSSHIPIIVLSAISSIDMKIKCIENGASLYIEKPFSLEYLSACIRGVLKKRDSVKNAYRPVIDVGEFAQASLPDRDDVFLRRLDEVIMDNLGDAAFSNKQMEEAMCLSRSSLNRRVNSLLHTTPNDYLRSKRLAVAAEMLKQGNARVGEVCFAVGFNSPSYFAKCFKVAYGMLPAEYAKSNASR